MGCKTVASDHIAAILPIAVSCCVQFILKDLHKLEFHYRFFCFVDMHTEKTKEQHVSKDSEFSVRDLCVK